MKQLSLDELRAFVSVIELQSYTAAGQLLGRSQPAISLQLRRLEEQLGASLLNRQRGRIQLTQAGQDVLDVARQLLGLNDQLLARFEQHALSGRVRLGIPSEFASKLLPQLLGQYTQSYPNVALEVTSALSKDLLAERTTQKFDLVIALQEPTEKPAGHVLKQEELVWVGRQTDFSEPVPLVFAPEGCIYRRRALQVLTRQQMAQRITYTNADFSGLTAAIEGGLGLTVLAQSTVPEHLLKLTSLPTLGAVNIVLQQHSSDNAAADYLASYLTDYLQSA
ncbi:transcriptional regulator, LysR family [Pseudidiomarina planktonica]|uniref:Transcriptional regulator, LysR family n=1 Tax=Pseudidiomarina planktonica TaxID=1323738 RepID=A0A1Y6FXW9_9GAMM|nr:LysR family transcriptional regulator [Pseudidiomarina planktonica]RUO63302.1 LysR family transcriptional regulator [Pseudidiomarina planktonica]SMQ80479.1 transcriptional regulator, LysR family [Pseudidiomarina planktonica]